jgi:hypothetical protein
MNRDLKATLALIRNNVEAVYHFFEAGHGWGLLPDDQLHAPWYIVNDETLTWLDHAWDEGEPPNYYTVSLIEVRRKDGYVLAVYHDACGGTAVMVLSAANDLKDWRVPD